MNVTKRIIFACLTLFFISAFTQPAGASILDDYIFETYSNLQPLGDSKPAYDIFQRGIIGYLNLKADGKKIGNEKLTLIDFRISANKKRMWVIDLTDNKVLYHRLVSHGKNTGGEYATSFSNIRNSNSSSLGFYLTGKNYTGKHGLSLRLDGLEAGFNDNARDRAIVMHGAGYVSSDFANLNGRLGRSLGCPAIALNKHEDIIKELAKQSVLFIYYPTVTYEQKTKYNNRMKAEAYLAGILNQVRS